MTDTTIAPSRLRRETPTPTRPLQLVTKVAGNEITLAVVAISPDLASQMLAHNSHNRNPRQRTIDLYATDMANGDWRFTAAPVTFDAAGNLLDGQHRLYAIVQANVTIPTLVVRGLETEAQDDTDRGIPRKFYDVLALRGETNASTLAAVVRRMVLWETGERRNIQNRAVSSAAMLRWLEANPQIRDICNNANRVGRGVALPASIIGTAWWLFAEVDDEDAAFFFDRLGDGQGLVKGDPIFELRRTLDNSKSVRGERSQAYLLAITIKAWNAYRDGRKDISLYKFRPGGAKPEAFPEPI